MVSVSLGTTDTHQARERARIKRDQLDRELEALGRQSRKLADGYTGAMLTLADADIDNLCLRYRAARLADDEIQRIAGLDDHTHKLDLDILEDGLRLLRSNYARGFLGDVYSGLDAFLRSIELRVPKNTPPYERLARRFQQAEIEVYDAILRRRQGQNVEIPLTPLDSLTYDDVFKTWKRRLDKRPPKTVRAFEQAFEELKAFCTATTPTMLRKADVVAFRDRLLLREGMSRRTVSKLLGFLHADFQCSVNDGALEINPFKGVEVAFDDQQLQQKARLPFSTEHLQKIFSGPVYQADFKPRPSLGQSCYWLPLLAL
jgi:hypothetical protein